MPTDFHGHGYEADWAPDNPVLRGETQVPDHVDENRPHQLDELPHRTRLDRGFNTPDPDPGYRPEWDDLL